MARNKEDMMGDWSLEDIGQKVGLGKKTKSKGRKGGMARKGQQSGRREGR